MCEFIRKSNERILRKLSKSEILRLYPIVHVAMETAKTSIFTCLSSFISIFLACQVSACELQPSSCHDLANDIRSQTAITVFSHLKVDVSGLLLGRSNHLSYKATTKSLHFGWSLTGGSTVFEINCNLLKPYSNYMITEM